VISLLLERFPRPSLHFFSIKQTIPGISTPPAKKACHLARQNRWRWRFLKPPLVRESALNTASVPGLGADTMNLQAEASSLKKGETLLDTAFNLNAMKPDCLVMRHSASGAADYVAGRLDIPVINARRWDT